MSLFETNHILKIGLRIFQTKTKNLLFFKILKLNQKTLQTRPLQLNILVTNTYTKTIQFVIDLVEEKVEIFNYLFFSVTLLSLK